MLYILLCIVCITHAQAYTSMLPNEEAYQKQIFSTMVEEHDGETQEQPTPFSVCLILGSGSDMNDKNHISTTFSTMIDLTYNMHKNIGIHMMSGITNHYPTRKGSMQDVNRSFVPFILEGRIAPVTREITPFISIGMGTMISEHLGLFGSKGFGLLIHSKKNQVEFHVRQIHGDLFLFDQEFPLRQPFQHNSLQVTFRTHLM